MVVALSDAPEARAESTNAPNPHNVLMLPNTITTPFGVWTAVPAATAPAVAPQAQPVQQPQRKRAARRKTRQAPATQPVVQPVEAAPQSAEPDWPSPLATAPDAPLVPIRVRTVREIVRSETVQPDPDTTLVSENELSDIDRAAPPVPTAAPASPAPELPTPLSTDGRAAADTDTPEQPQVFAMAETMKAVTQSALLEPVLLMLAGALAAMSAVRLFA